MVQLPHQRDNPLHAMTWPRTLTSRSRFKPERHNACAIPAPTEVPAARRSLWDDVRAGRACASATLAMNRDTILLLLSEHLPEVRERFGVRRLAVFGSAARDELRPKSDVDVLVEFEGATTFDHYFSLRDVLEQVLGRRVDLVTHHGLKPRARRHAEKDLIRVA